MLPPPEEDLERRRPLWQALSDLFLDDETTADTLSYIALVAASSAYTEDEIEAIYRREVAPAVAGNFFDPAGVWGCFNPVILERWILERCSLGYWFSRLIVAPLPLWILRHDWRRVKILVARERESAREAKERVIEPWKNLHGETSP